MEYSFVNYSSFAHFSVTVILRQIVVCILPEDSAFCALGGQRMFLWAKLSTNFFTHTCMRCSYDVLSINN